MDLRTIFKNRLGQNPALSIMCHGKNSFGSSSTCVSRISNPAYRLLASDLDWLVRAGVTIAAYNVDEPCAPLEMCKKRNLFNLFYNDVSLLTESPLRKRKPRSMCSACARQHGGANHLLAHLHGRTVPQRIIFPLAGRPLRQYPSASLPVNVQ